MNKYFHQFFISKRPRLTNIEGDIQLDNSYFKGNFPVLNPPFSPKKHTQREEALHKKFLVPNELTCLGQEEDKEFCSSMRLCDRSFSDSFNLNS